MFIINKVKNIIDIKEKSKICFQTASIEWLNYKKLTIKDSTYFKYLGSVNKYLIPEFGSIKLKDLQTYDFNLFVSKLSNNKISPQSIKNILCILKSVLNYAEENYDFKFKTSNLIIPHPNKRLLEILSQREKAKLENYCMENVTLKTMGIIICLNTGLRIGEICALKWKNIDFSKKLIHITSTMQRTYNAGERKSKIIINSPKTKNSLRDIPISSKLYRFLLPIKKKNKYKDEDYLLTGSEDMFIEPRNYQNSFKEILKKCKIRSYNFHILRHTFATNCVGIGMDVKSLSAVLGHSNVSITLNQYVHSSHKIQRKFLEKL